MRDEGTGSDRMMRKSALIVMGFAALFGGLRDTFTRHRVAAPFHLPPNTTPPFAAIIYISFSVSQGTQGHIYLSRTESAEAVLRTRHGGRGRRGRCVMTRQGENT